LDIFANGAKACALSLAGQHIGSFALYQRFRRTMPVIYAGFRDERSHMLDLLMLAMGAGFFAIALAYVIACNNL
jgi:hypothetical protein